MGKLTHNQIINMKSSRVSESVGGRGDGALVFERRKSEVTESYYRYSFKGKDTRLKIGLYKVTRTSPGLNLADTRDKAHELSRLRRDCGGDLKGYLARIKQDEEQQLIEEQRKLELEAMKGTFADLIQAYCADQKLQGKPTAEKTENGFARNVFKPYPAMVRKKAKDITPDDVVTILAKIHNRGSPGESVRFRGILHACFSFGQKSDYDPTRQGEKRFHIQHNPVSAVRKNTQAVKVGDRVLSNDEVKRLWDNVDKTHGVGFIAASFVKFMFATGGQRPLQLLAAKWEDYDFQRNCVTLLDSKGKGSVKQHVIPLTHRAISILEEVRIATGGYPYPFCSGRPSRKSGELTPITLDGLKNVFIRYNKQITEEALNAGNPAPKHFTARDIRRTVKNILIDARVSREHRNLLQSHALTGVDFKNYDRHEHLPEKREAIRLYDALLEKIINGDEVKLVDLEEYRHRSTSNK